MGSIWSDSLENCLHFFSYSLNSCRGSSSIEVEVLWFQAMFLKLRDCMEIAIFRTQEDLFVSAPGIVDFHVEMPVQ